MYINHNIRKPTIREINRFDVVQAKNVNTKKLKMLNKSTAEQLFNARRFGGRLYLGKGFGSWIKKSFGKVKNFAKNAFNKVIKPVYKKVIKPGLTFLTKNEIGKQITQQAANIIGSAASAIPGVGPIVGPAIQKTLPTALNAADSITTAAEKVVQGIRDKNPQVSLSQAKDIVGTIKNTYNTLSNEAKKIKEEQTKKGLEQLPEAIKAEGFEAVMKAAPFIPLLDLETLKTESKEMKGGKIKEIFKIRKPKNADNFGKYSAPIVARVAGRIYMGGRVELGEEQSTGSSGACGRSLKISTLHQPKTGGSSTSSTASLLEQLKRKYK